MGTKIDMQRLGHLFLALFILFSLASCTHKTVVQDRSRTDEAILIGSWNIQKLGKSKTSKTEILDKITDVISRYDIIAIQEITDVTGITIPRVMDSLLKKNRNYAYLLSERIGKEQYAFIYRKNKIEIKSEGGVYAGASAEVFSRPPHHSYFKSKSGKFDFVLINIHVAPKNALEEISALSTVHKDLKKTYMNEGDFIILGDLNADCSYFNESNTSIEIRKNPYIWIIDDNQKTNVSQRDCTYDRIIITKESEEDFTGKSSVYHFDKRLDLEEDTNKYSDHYPVESLFYIDRDAD